MSKQSRKRPSVSTRTIERFAAAYPNEKSFNARAALCLADYREAKHVNAQLKQANNYHKAQVERFKDDARLSFEACDSLKHSNCKLKDDIKRLTATARQAVLKNKQLKLRVRLLGLLLVACVVVIAKQAYIING